MEIKTTYENCKMLIEAGRFTSHDIGILSLFLMVGAINNDQYVELTGMLAPQKEKPTAATASTAEAGEADASDNKSEKPDSAAETAK